MTATDDLLTRVQQSGGGVIQSIDDLISSNQSSADDQVKTVTDDQTPGGNRSAADIFNGIFGGVMNIAKPAAPAAATANAAPYPSATAAVAKYSPWLIPIIAVGAVYLYTRRA